jgi:hypothetical protein
MKIIFQIFIMMYETWIGIENYQTVTIFLCTPRHGFTLTYLLPYPPTNPFNLIRILEIKYIIKVNTYPWLNKNYQILEQVPTTLSMFLSNVL